MLTRIVTLAFEGGPLDGEHVLYDHSPPPWCHGRGARYLFAEWRSGDLTAVYRLHEPEQAAPEQPAA
ncbi:MAG TPA: hypothetical protein VHF47_02650 [Acidimicrobiales bacterium]|nr:hypothetical protein [Acidimicrobiales bacterium]